MLSASRAGRSRRSPGTWTEIVCAYLSGERQPGVRKPAGDDPFDVVADYIGQRLTDDPHVLATALVGEAVALGYPR